MVKIDEPQTQQTDTTGSTIVSCGAKPTPAERDHLVKLLEAATRAAIEGALTHGVDMPVGAAMSKDGRIISATYAQDNLTHDEDAHAERMAVQLAYKQSPDEEPDTIAVTLEPCGACQDYLATVPGLRRVVYTLPLSAASSRDMIRPKDETIFERDRRNRLPYQIIQINNEQLSTLSELLLDVTTRDISTGESVIDDTKLREQLPIDYLPVTDIYQ